MPFVLGRKDGGGRGGSQPVNVYDISYDDPGLSDGITVWTPADGDVVLDIRFVVDTAWDGTTPKADFGFGAGIINAFGSVSAMDATTADTLNACGLLNQSDETRSIIQAQVYSSAAPWFANSPLDGTPLKVWVSQDGSAGGADPGSSQGAARLIVWKGTP